MSSVNPFSYNSGDVSSYNYKRLDPSPFWNPPYSFAKKKKKSKFVNKDENIKKIVRNVKSLPEHLIGRFKHNKENSKKSKVEWNPSNAATKGNIFSKRIIFLFQDALNFGRGGHGAPVRTKSGRLRSTLLGNPEIRLAPCLGQRTITAVCLLLQISSEWERPEEHLQRHQIRRGQTGEIWLSSAAGWALYHKTSR